MISIIIHPEDSVKLLDHVTNHEESALSQLIGLPEYTAW